MIIYPKITINMLLRQLCLDNNLPTHIRFPSAKASAIAECQSKFWRLDIYINSNLDPIAKVTRSSKNTEFKDTLPWNIPQMILLTSTRIIVSYAMKWASPETTRSEFPSGGKAIVEQILPSKEKNISKRAGLWESQ